LRDYFDEVKDDEFQKIDYIISTLAEKPLLKLLWEKNELKQEGEKIEHIHPLKFLLTVFENDNLNESFKKLSKRSYVWDEFLTFLL
jgi:hypothetical protein